MISKVVLWNTDNAEKALNNLEKHFSVLTTTESCEYVVVATLKDVTGYPGTHDASHTIQEETASQTTGTPQGLTNPVDG